jgi:hypothetical protein
MISFEDLKKKMIYIGHPWTYNPYKSFQNAVKWTRQLRQFGFFVFSPILHTHPYWKETKNWVCGFGGLPENCPKDSGECETTNCKYFGYKEDWLDWDLRIIKGFMKNDGGMYYPLFQGEQMGRFKFDSGIFIVLSKTAFTHVYADNIQGRDWHSKGCKTEYEFAKENFIQIFELESFLEGKLKEL